MPALEEEDDDDNDNDDGEEEEEEEVVAVAFDLGTEVKLRYVDGAGFGPLFNASDIIRSMVF